MYKNVSLQQIHPKLVLALNLTYMILGDLHTDENVYNAENHTEELLKTLNYLYV